MERVSQIQEGEEGYPTRSKVTHNAKTRRKIRAGVKLSKLDLVFGFRPSPVELDAVFSDPDIADMYRFKECPGYSDCLSIACIGLWDNFSCMACNVYKQYCKHSSNPIWTKRIRRI
jgi:hypothetical protein